VQTLSQCLYCTEAYIEGLAEGTAVFPRICHQPHMLIPTSKYLKS